MTAAVLDAVSHPATPLTAPGTISWSHPCAGSNRVLYAAFNVDCGTTDATVVTAATYGGAAMTSLGRWHSGGSAQHVGFVEVFKLIAPPAGTATIAMTCSGGTTIDSVDGGAMSWNGADQTTGNGTVAHSDSGGGSTTSGSVSVPSTTSGNPIAAFLTNGSGATVFTTGTSQWVFNSSNNGGAGAFAMATETSAGGTASVAWTQASDFYGAQAFEILPASAPPAHTPDLLMACLP